MVRRFVDRFRRGRLLGREAIAILRAYPKLLFFPLASAAALVALIAVLMSPVVYLPLMTYLTSAYFEQVAHSLASGPDLDQMLEQLPWTRFATLGLLAVSCVYAAIATVMYFFNVALVASIIQFDRSGTMSLRHGLGVAVRRLPQILAWSLFASTIGIVLKMLTHVLGEYLSWFGSLLGLLGEVAFAVAAYFVVPLLAVDGVGPITAVRRSASLIRAKWGKVAGAEFTTFWYYWPLHLIGFLAVVGIWMLPTGPHQGWLLAGAIFCCAVTMVLNFVTSGVIMSQLYIFASTGKAPNASDASIYEDAFAKK